MVVLFATDHHYDDNTTWRANSIRGWGNLSNVLHARTMADCLILGGDNVDSEHLEKSTNIKYMDHMLSSLFSASGIDRFVLRGNHDAGTLQQYNNNSKKVMLDNIIGRAEFAKLFKADETLFGEIRNGDSLYFYKDYPTKKVRVVGLDSIDNPEATNSDGSLKYFDQWDYGYQQTQLKWFAEQALGTLPQEYHVVVFSHLPLNNSVSTGNEQRRNFDCLQKIITAFVNKKSDTIKSNLIDFEVNFTVDYSSRQSSNFVGFFSGHEHRDWDVDMGSFKSITINRAWPATTIDVWNEDAFSAIEIDTANRVVNIKGFGRVDSRSFSY